MLEFLISISDVAILQGYLVTFSRASNIIQPLHIFNLRFLLLFFHVTFFSLKPIQVLRYLSWPEMQAFFFFEENLDFLPLKKYIQNWISIQSRSVAFSKGETYSGVSLVLFQGCDVLSGSGRECVSTLKSFFKSLKF